MTKPELLAPAGNLAKLKCAFRFGADAVYVGGKSFSLRAFADNFTDEELAEGIAYAHERGKKVYAAANIFARNADFPAMAEHFRTLEGLGADAVLVSDLGTLALARRDLADPWELLCAYAVNVHSYTGFAAASQFGERSVIATDLIDYIGPAMQLITEEALEGMDAPAGADA